MKIERGSCVAVEWLDACTDSEWQTASTYDPEPVPFTTVGFVLAHHTTHITLAMSLSDVENDTSGPHFTIPQGMIQEIRPLKVAASMTGAMKRELAK